LEAQWYFTKRKFHAMEAGLVGARGRSWGWIFVKFFSVKIKKAKTKFHAMEADQHK
jgi:hypothetical protein